MAINYFVNKYQMLAGQNTVRPSETVNNFFFGGSTNPSNSHGRFATATLQNGVVTVSGDKSYGGDSSAVADFISSSVEILAVVAEGGFVAIKNDGSLKSWGNWAGKNVNATNVTEIAVSQSGWAALKSDSTIISFGAYQSDKPSGANFVKVFAGGYGGYAALTDKGELVTWGYLSGISNFKDSPETVPSGSLDSGVVDVAFNSGSGIALKNDGSTVTWGHSGYQNELKTWNFSSTNQPTLSPENALQYAEYALYDAKMYLDETQSTAKSADWIASQKNATASDIAAAKQADEDFAYAKEYLKTAQSTYDAMVLAHNSPPDGEVTIYGQAQQNQELTASNYLRDDDGLGTISYQWLSNGSVISGATKETYTLTADDVGKTISVQANYTDLKNHAESVTSAATAVVVPVVNHAPTGNVTISGILQDGQKLTINNTLYDEDGLGAFSYQWLSGNSPIKGATQSTYTLTSSDVGKTISVQTNYTDLKNHAESVTSAATASVTSAAVAVVVNLKSTNGNDKLIGTAKADVLNGGLGFDELTGGKGADKFVFSDVKDAPVSHSKIDIITDFSSSEKDKIDLSKIDADISKLKDQKFSAPISGDEFSGVFEKAGQLFFEKSTGILYGNVNSEGTADFAIQLNGVKSLVAGDLTL